MSANAKDIMLDHLFATSKAMLGIDRFELAKTLEILSDARERKNFVWLVGNGGSAATASHFANDLEKVCALRAISIPDLVPMMTAHGNDAGWDKMFSHALQGYQKHGDVLIIFSCSGSSVNVIEAAKNWDAFESPIIVFTGDNRDSQLVQEASAEVIIFVDNPEIMIQESVHLTLCHAIVDTLKEISNA